MSGPIRTLDDAWAAQAAGRSTDALRACLAILAADPSQVGAAALAARVLHSLGEPTPPSVVDVFVRRGDLPMAVALAELTEHARATRRAIAEAFGRGSKRAKDVAPAPPPLPPSVITVSKQLAEADEAALRKEGRAALTDLGTDLPAAAPVPILPLFGALDPSALEQLLGAWDVRLLSAGDVAVHEGDEGKDAFVVVRGALRATRTNADGSGELVLAQLGPGAIFGEMALVSDAPRAASVSAIEPTLLLVAGRDALEGLAKETPEIGKQLSEFCRARMISNLMRHSAILASVEVSDREALIGRFAARRFSRGEALVELGEQTDGLFLLASGAVKVVGRDADGDELELAQLGPGDVVGEISLVLRRPASADVLATHPTVALELKREQFQEAIREHPTLLSELYELATKREEETRSVVAQETLDVEDVVLL
ncbi:MAG: cyclic nucleotide-binding domain-containing protein [Sandaracinaceae bacterium]